jgi:hypothetical protein
VKKGTQFWKGGRMNREWIKKRFSPQHPVNPVHPVKKVLSETGVEIFGRTGWGVDEKDGFFISILQIP